MKFLKIFFKSLIIIILVVIILLSYLTLKDYRPEESEMIQQNEEFDKIPLHEKFILLNWNIGYGGLGDDMDFFYDDGKRVRTTEVRTEQNLESIGYTLEKMDSLSFILLQEVDIKAKRSYYIDQEQVLQKKLRKYFPGFSKNYDATFVPLPFFAPMGKVKSGLLTFSRYQPQSVIRYDFPGSYTWPKRLFMLDRCFMVFRYPLENGKEFIVINTHNSAFDDGSLKKEEMACLKNFLLQEYEKGNYILVGGDWNQNPPGINADHFKPNPGLKNFQLHGIKASFMPSGWKWVFDEHAPTNRYLNEPYSANTFVTILDFFLLSPNLNYHWVKTLDLAFKNSDHQPVMIKISFEDV